MGATSRVCEQQRWKFVLTPRTINVLRIESRNIHYSVFNSHVLISRWIRENPICINHKPVILFPCISWSLNLILPVAGDGSFENLSIFKNHEPGIVSIITTSGGKPSPKHGPGEHNYWSHICWNISTNAGGLDSFTFRKTDLRLTWQALRWTSLLVRWTSYSTVLRACLQSQVVGCRKSFVVLRELIWTLSISILRPRNMYRPVVPITLGELSSTTVMLREASMDIKHS